MGKYVFDHSTGKPVFALDDNAAIDENGDILIRLTDDLAASAESGAHFISGWESENSFDSDYDY